MVSRLVMLACMCVLACRVPDAPPSAPSPLRDEPVPTFARPALGGGNVDLEALRGKVVVVEFFAQYCAPCRRTLPEAERLHRRHPDVAFVGVSEDEYESQAPEMVTSLGLSFPIVHDRGRVLAGRFRVFEIPATFVVDEEGVVRWVSGASHVPGDLERAIVSVRGRG
jgi:peroxiredoxin